MNQDESAKPYPQLLDWLRYFCAFMLYMYGVSKLSHLQFNMSSALAQRSIGSLNGYELTWFYYGYSRVYASVGPHAGRWCDAPTLQEDYLACRGHYATGDGEHPAHQHVHSGQRLWAVPHFSTHQHLTVDHSLASAGCSPHPFLGDSEQRTSCCESNPRLDSSADCVSRKRDHDLNRNHAALCQALASATGKGTLLRA